MAYIIVKQGETIFTKQKYTEIVELLNNSKQFICLDEINDEDSFIDEKGDRHIEFDKIAINKDNVLKVVS